MKLFLDFELSSFNNFHFERASKFLSSISCCLFKAEIVLCKFQILLWISLYSLSWVLFIFQIFELYEFNL